MKPCAPWHLSDRGVVFDDDHRDVPAAVVGPERLNEGEIAETGGPEVGEYDLRERLFGPTQGICLIQSHEHCVALAFESRLMSSTGGRFIVDQQSGTVGIQGDPHNLLLG